SAGVIPKVCVGLTAFDAAPPRPLGPWITARISSRTRSMADFHRLDIARLLTVSPRPGLAPRSFGFLDCEFGNSDPANQPIVVSSLGFVKGPVPPAGTARCPWSTATRRRRSLDGGLTRLVRVPQGSPTPIAARGASSGNARTRNRGG